MTILFAGGELGAFVGSDSTAGEATTASQYDSSFSRAAIGAQGTSQYLESPEFTAVDELFVHFTTGQRDVGGSGNGLCALLSGGTEVFRLYWNTTQIRMEYWNGAAWVAQGSNITLDITNARQTIDMYVVGGGSGTAELFVGGSSRTTASGSYTNVANVDQIRMYGNFPPVSYTQVIVADEPTIGWRLKTVPATGAGATTDWTGTYSEIDEAVNNDVDFINSASVNQVELFSHSTTVPSGYDVRGVIVTARAKCGLTGPQNIQLALRSAGTTYFSSTQALGLGYGANVAIWETDPATAAAFTVSAVNALQFGVKSIT